MFTSKMFSHKTWKDGSLNGARNLVCQYHLGVLGFFTLAGSPGTTICVSGKLVGVWVTFTLYPAGRI